MGEIEDAHHAGDDAQAEHDQHHHGGEGQQVEDEFDGDVHGRPQRGARACAGTDLRRDGEQSGTIVKRVLLVVTRRCNKAAAKSRDCTLRTMPLCCADMIRFVDDGTQ